ncbi:MAG: hypothetical protein ACI4RH_04925 [Huintestinicola sp.]
MVHEKLENIIPNITGRTMGELYYELLDKGYSDTDAQLLINRYMASLAKPPSKPGLIEEIPGWREMDD